MKCTKLSRLINVAASCATVAGTLLAGPTASAAPAYPGRFPVHLIVAYTAGGTTDYAGRKIAELLSAQTKGSFIVDNRPGASGQIGTSYVVRSAPDAHTLLVMDTTYTMLPSMYPHLPWNIDTDLIPISNIADTPVILVVNAASPYKTLRDFVDAAKASPGKLTYGSAGVGSATDLAMALFEQQAHMKLTHIPYKGASEAMLGVVENSVQALTSPGPTVIPQIRSGRLRALAVSSPQRLKGLPDVPTFAQAGFSDYKVVHWFGLAAPRGTPQALITQIQGLMQNAMKDPGYVQGLDALGATPGGLNAADFRQRMEHDITLWTTISQQTYPSKKTSSEQGPT
jgi:tripartite-type tricarboxylate transporter receptor subunit TctC